ncbi:short chain enoyl-CoA hydratase [Cytobacillus firmus]|uniref:Short chain enoyl-CoA hydratase n=2 Tax=Cytobacillus TaxID=2675230 RepID=A0A366JZB2_CYTFI|nr:MULTISPECIES: enoyl-CoA hydratase-related protein [Cytobacillus]RBP94412.1 short chain enoyl-CoA hydratase [Cytobacillus firmus]TDX43159.1 enoyl-CoA hydratase [Cytobacillus oceanisediminis]
MHQYENLLVQIEQGVMWLTINRPEQRNALNQETLQELGDAFSQADANDEVKCIIIQGAGEKSFAAGADIKQLHERKMLEALIPGMQGLYKKIEQSSKVTIAAVKGYALGGGCELALACDIRIAAKGAKFGLPELNLGIIPGAGGTQRLSRVAGKGRALDMILTGKIIDGEEAERIGLVTYLAPDDELVTKAEEVASQILKKGPVAIKLAKLAVHKGFDVDLETAMLIEKLSQAVAFGTEDKREGTAAFLDKRTAAFTNQ